MNTQPPTTQATNGEMKIYALRETFAARLLTRAQFNEAMAITDIIRGEIMDTGTFKDKLGDYAHAFARNNRFDTSRAESTLRDLFRERNGQTMNEMRKELIAREDDLKLDDPTRQQARHSIAEIATRISEGDKIAFNRAFHESADGLADVYGITNAGARRLMADVHRDDTQTELYEWGKELEETYYRPQIEAEREAREAASECSAPSRGQSRPSRSASRQGRASAAQSAPLRSGPSR